LKNLLIFHAGALGDLVNTIPAISALRAHFTDAQVTAAGNLSFLKILRSAGLADHAISLESPGMHALFSEQNLPPRIEEFISNFDVAVSWIRSPVLAGHLESLGVRTAALKEDFPPPPGSGHVIAVMNAPVCELGIENIPPYPRLEMPAEVTVTGAGLSGIIVDPGSGSPHKNWPAKRLPGRPGV